MQEEQSFSSYLPIPLGKYYIVPPRRTPHKSKVRISEPRDEFEFCVGHFFVVTKVDKPTPEEIQHKVDNMLAKEGSHILVRNGNNSVHKIPIISAEGLKHEIMCETTVLHMQDLSTKDNLGIISVPWEKVHDVFRMVNEMPEALKKEDI